jgi:hypothetical protein
MQTVLINKEDVCEICNFFKEFQSDKAPPPQHTNRKEKDEILDLTRM